MAQTELNRIKSASTQRLIYVAETSAHSLNNFDAIRLAMALLVVWSHSFALHLGSERTEWISVALNGTYNAGNLGVMAFFVISGFLITQSWERSKSAVAYFDKRVRRIYPGYLVAAWICAFMIAPLFGGPFPNIARTISSSLWLKVPLPEVFVHNPGAPINGSLWSIPYEFWCYIGVAIGSWLLLRRPRLIIMVCVLLMVGKLFQDVSGRKPGLGVIGSIIGWPYLWTKIGPSFLLGMIAYAYREWLPRSPLMLVGLIVVTVASCWLSEELADFLVAPTLAYLVFYVSFTTRLKFHNAARFGDLSYGTYLYAFPIQQIIQATFGESLGLGAFFGLSASLSLIAGFASWHLVEKHFRTKQKKPLKPPMSPPDPPLTGTARVTGTPQL